MNALGYKNVFIGTVEGEPEETACENVIEAVKAIEIGDGTAVVSPTPRQLGKEVTLLEPITSLIVSVMAGVICHLICK